MERYKAPYTFKEWLIHHFGRIPDGNYDSPRVMYDGYVFSLEQLGYTVYGNCYNGITVS